MSTRITDLPQAEVLNGSEVMPLVQNGVTKKATLDFINLASPAALILQQTQQVYQDTVGVKAETDAVLVETQSVLGDTRVVLGQTIGVRNETQGLKLDFETQYLGPHASPPTLDNEGNPLQNGALYWDTTLMAMFVWSGVSWTAFSSTVASVNGYIGEVILGFADVGAAGLGANTNITSLGGLTGDVATATGVQFDTAAPSAAAAGKLTWNTVDQTLDLGLSAGGVSMQIGQGVYYRVKNGTAGVIPNGSMVRYTGTEGLAGSILVAPALANGAVASQTFLGLTTGVLNPGDSGFATHFGRVRGIDTTGNPYGEVWADGDVIFASALVAGWLTKNSPEAPNNRVRVGIVVHAHPNGVLFVNPTYGGKLSENEQVQLASLADGDVLQYDASQSRFENRTLAGAGIEPIGAASSSMAAHLASSDPHPQYTTAAEASAAAPVQSVAGKTGAVSLTNADVGLGNVANVLQAAAARVLTAGDGLTGGGDLSANRTLTLGTPSTLTTVTTNSVTATSHTHAVTFPITSVAGKTGAVALVKADVGLGNVDNTSDADKPVSTATATALNLKFDKAGGSITGNTNITVNSASEALRITQTGTGLALRVEDSANPDSTPFAVDANGNVGVKTAAPSVSFAVNASDAILVPIGSTANRPTGATGYFRFNTELAQFEGYDGTAWDAISKPDASLVGFQQAGTGAVVRTAQDKMREWVSLADFIPSGTNTETADCSPYMQAALVAGGGGVFLPPGRYRMATQISLPVYTFYDDTPGRTIFGHNAQIIVETTVPLFTNDQVAEPTGYTSKWKFKDLSFFSSTANSKLFDMDRIYNSVFSHCVFEGIASVFYSRVDRTGSPSYPDGYIQSACINNNHFAQCAKGIDAKRAFNLAVSHNYFEACGTPVAVDGLGDPACNMIRITDNVMEGGSGTPIILGGVFGGVIQGNYFEANSGSPTCDVKLDVSGASSHRGLAIIGNQFQPTTAQKADTNWFCIRLANTLSAGRGPSILSNTTSGGRLVTGADRHSLVTGNYETGSSQVLDSFPVPQQTNVEIGGISNFQLNNKATAYDSGTATWKVIKIDNIARNAVYEVDGFLNLYNIGGTLLGRTLVSFKFWVQIDGQAVYTAGLLGVAQIEDLTGARDSSGNPMYSSYWGTVTPTFAFSGSTLTISFDAFNDYSMPGYGQVYSLGPNLAVRVMKGDPSFTRVQISMP